MNRRSSLKALLTAAGAAPLLAQDKKGGARRAAARAIQLHLDMEVDPSKEQEMLANFRKVFRPTISKQPGFVAVRLLKLRKAMAGSAPKDCPYRLIISFETEEQRQTWVATDEHQKAWPTIEGTLKGAKYVALLYDPV